MPARLHPGTVIHVWDHYVIELRDGDRSAKLSLYDIGWSPELGGGQVAFLTGIGAAPSVMADPADLGHRMQRRLRAMGGVGEEIDAAVVPSRFERLPAGSQAIGWTIRPDAGPLVEARWLRPEAVVWVEGPAPAFWDREDIWACFVGAPQATITLDGSAVPGEVFQDGAWAPKLGRTFSSAHVALAEVRVEPVR
jgi:hypothetical protein